MGNTYDALEEAITNYVLEESIADADIVRDWVIVASTASIDDDGDEVEIAVHRSANTALYAVTGLLEWGKLAYGGVE